MVDGLRRLRKEENITEEKRQVENITDAVHCTKSVREDVLCESIHIYQNE